MGAMNSGAHGDHCWSFDQHSYEDVSDDGRYVEWRPTGYSSFRCSCGLSEKGATEMVGTLAKIHLELETA
jgi:hypothetical protein